MKNALALKIVFAFLCLLMLGLQLRSMSGWNESRGVFDDICYLRQAHLFHRFGLAGFDTEMSRDDDGYERSKLKQIGFAGWNDPKDVPCHNVMDNGRIVIQYPPGVGMVLALFPEGHQVVPMFWLSTIAVFGFACLAIFRARTAGSIVIAGLFGLLVTYMMINPIKASYSMAPTAVVCALCGYITARWLAEPRYDTKIAPVVALGFLLGVGVDFRLANLFLAGGYGMFLLVSFLISRTASRFLQGVLFGVALVVGMLPTLISHWINTGSPFTSTYHNAPDIRPPDFTFSVVWDYLNDYFQCALVALALAGTAALWLGRDRGLKRLGWLLAANLAINLAFFLTHPIATPYYILPIALLTLWSVLFAVVMRDSQIAGNEIAGTIGAVSR